MIRPATIGKKRTGAANGGFLYTARSPPIEFLKKVVMQWPAWQFVLAYREPGMAFKGLAKFQGEIHEDHYISL